MRRRQPPARKARAGGQPAANGLYFLYTRAALSLRSFGYEALRRLARHAQWAWQDDGGTASFAKTLKVNPVEGQCSTA